MPVFTNPISSQNTATTAGVNNYPSFAQIKQNAIYRDTFSRETLNTTGAYTLYTTAVDASGTVGIVNQSTCNVKTDVNTNNQAQIHTSGFTFPRTDWYADTRSAINLDIIFDCPTTTNVQYFIGILFLQPAASLSALPTTKRHMGLYLDTSVSNNFKLSSANNTTQVTTDTGKAVDTSVYRLNIEWTGRDNGLISLYGPVTTGGDLTPFGTLIKSQTVTSLIAGSTIFEPTNGYEMYAYVKTLTTAAATLEWQEWNMVVT